MLGHARLTSGIGGTILESYFAIRYLSVTVCAFNSPDTALACTSLISTEALSCRCTAHAQLPPQTAASRKPHTSAMPSAVKPPQTLYDKVFEDHIVEEKEDGTVLLYIGMSRLVLFAVHCLQESH